MSTVTLTQFRAIYPIFEDSETYPEPQVQFFLDLADKTLNPDRWGESFSFGASLFVAHFITRYALAAKEAANGGVGGLRGGVVSSESGDSVAVSFSVSESMESDAGHWNGTEWGRQYIHFARMFGAGPMQVGAESGGANVSASTWAGPPMWW